MLVMGCDTKLGKRETKGGKPRPSGLGLGDSLSNAVGSTGQNERDK